MAGILAGDEKRGGRIAFVGQAADRVADGDDHDRVPTRQGPIARAERAERVLAVGLNLSRRRGPGFGGDEGDGSAGQWSPLIRNLTPDR